MHLGHTQAANEMWYQTGRMPSRPGGELPFFDKDDVIPAFFGQKVQQPGAERAAANNHHPCMLFHFLTPPLLILILCPLPDQ